MKKNIYKFKKYKHFDSIKHYCRFIKYIEKPENIEKHGFYPFLHYKIKNRKYNGKIIKTKEREIYYASHIDRYIYEYYASKLNEEYNQYAKKSGINHCVIAYRDNLHKNNIHFAKEAFNFLKQNNNLFIYLSDFSSYFDNLNHAYLKQKIQDVINSKLTNDLYKVFKSVTRYAYIDYDDILKYKNTTRKELRKEEKVTTLEEFKIIKKTFLNVNQKDFGIPQGSSISSVLSNIYLIDFDIAINNYITSNKGYYKRYCDDIFIAIPCNLKNNTLLFIESELNKIPNLKINKDKTEKYSINNNKIIDENGKSSMIKYLGFSFNGVKTYIREQTMSRYYIKMHRVLNYINKKSNNKKKNILRKKFYKNFSHLGNKKGSGNFITYVNRCASIFNEVNIKNQIKNHWNIIEKKLVKIK